jgi:Protein of unknown function (DUF4242)
MPKYVIERDIPDAGKYTEEQLKTISQQSCGILREMGPHIQWMHSYITDNKVYCVYVADSEEDIKDHAKRGNYPANRISEVRGMIDPATAGR